MEAAAAKQLIERRYAAVHGALAAADFHQFCVIGAGGDLGPCAAPGFRLAGAEQLFLEEYLDVSIETAVSEALSVPIDRDRIVEIGAHASTRSRATVALWARTARHLSSLADVAVAVLTDPLRAMFRRLDIAFHEICDADPQRLPDGGSAWGRYYELNPRVCAGLIAPALLKLAMFDDGPEGLCA